MNTELLLKVKDAILAHPENFNMSMWIEGVDNTLEFREAIEDEIAPCGTTACIAGWAIALGRPTEAIDDSLYDLETEARKTLGITRVEGDAMFRCTYWPERFKSRYMKAGDPIEAARVAADYIDHLITTESTSP